VSAASAVSVTEAGIRRPVTSARRDMGARIIGFADDDDLDGRAYITFERA
jgi:hypothetical protein